MPVRKTPLQDKKLIIPDTILPKIKQEEGETGQETYQRRLKSRHSTLIDMKLKAKKMRTVVNGLRAKIRKRAIVEAELRKEIKALQRDVEKYKNKKVYKKDYIYKTEIKKRYKTGTYDFLKYYRLVVRWVRTQHELTQSEFDTLCFLYSEPAFPKSKYKQFALITPWDNDRFERLLERGYIVVFRESAKVNGRVQAARYMISHKGQQIIIRACKIMLGETTMTENEDNNKLIMRRLGQPKTYKELILQMNREIREKMAEKRAEKKLD